MSAFLIKSTRFLGTVPHPHTSNWSIIGQDGGQSIEMGDKTLFVFSDTLITCKKKQCIEESHPSPYTIGVSEHELFLANCAGVSSKKKIRDALRQLDYYTDDQGLPRYILKTTPHERPLQLRFWPEHGIFIDGKIYLYYLGVKTTDPKSIWGFRNMGTGLAILYPETGECTRLFYQDDWCLWRSIRDDFHFGVQVIRENEHVYVFASIREGISTTARLACVHVEEISNPSAYKYLCTFEPQWSQDINKACSLGECGPEYSVSYNPYLQKYLLVYLNEYEKKLIIRTANKIWGPYSNPLKIISVPHKETSELVYLGFEHPVFSENNGKDIYISYCQPDFKINSLISISFF